MKHCLFITLCMSCLLSGNVRAEDAAPLYPVQEKGKWGFINALGQIVIPPQYDNCYYPFSEGLAAVEVGSKWGYIDRHNKMVIQPQFDSAENFKDGIASVRIGEPFEGKGKSGCIDKSGHFVLGPEESGPRGECREGLRYAKKDGKWGYLDTKWNWAIPATFIDANSFSSGLAGVRLDENTAGFINKKGKWVIRLNAAVSDYEGFSEGLAPVLDLKSKQYGFIDKTGSFVIAPRFDQVRGFHEGRAAVCIRTLDDTGWPLRRWGAIDKTGRLVIPAKYETLWSFEEGMAKVVDASGSGFVDLDGKQVIPCTFKSADPFKNGLALVRVGPFCDDKTGWEGYINKKGDFVWRPSDYQARDAARAKEEAEKKARKPSIVLLTDEATKKKGLLITCPKKVPFKGDKAGKILIRITNLLEAEVFVEVEGNESPGYSLESWDGGFASGVGSMWVFPDNTYLLKRLHASRYSGDKRITCGCCMAMIVGQLDESALEMGRARGTISLDIRGFYRNTGKSFSESIELPIELVEDVKGQQEKVADKK
ncbi:MAG: WG repeat-containing protein [Pirellulales bacterium]|nr:WG repeat-containing protein [Pirellulales bacterium]